MLSNFELGWLVAILEGEGSFHFAARTQCVEVQMTDEDVIYRIASLFERITESSIDVVHRMPRGYNHQEAYRVRVYGDKARKIMRLVVTHMGYRRRQRIWQCLNEYAERKVVIDLVEILQIKEAKVG